MPLKQVRECYDCEENLLNLVVGHVFPQHQYNTYTPMYHYHSSLLLEELI